MEGEPLSILQKILEDEAEDWNFDPLRPTIDYSIVGNMRERLGNHWTKLVEFAQSLDKITDQTSIFDVAPGQSADPDTARNLSQAAAMGYHAENTAHHKAYADQYPEIFDPVTAALDLIQPTASLIHQKPGWFCPWHSDIFTFYAIKHGLEDKAGIGRYLVFIEDWSWGHYLLVGNSVVHQWKAGDTITWPHKMRHLSANAGAKPKLTLQVTGRLSSDRLALSTRAV